jgi:NADH dehydrogenase FAD-containing subunit
MAIARRARDGVLILGGGFAGAYVARLLESGSTIVSLENYMLYTPMLPEAASGTLEPRHTVVPLRQMCKRSDLLLGRVTGIDDVLGLHLRGFLGWFVTRTYHLYQLPLFTRKLRVVADWTVALFFPRDLAELGGLGRPRGLRDKT